MWIETNIILEEETSFDRGGQKKKHLKYLVIANSNTNLFSSAKELHLVVFPS